jgi:hypothetical protein
MRFDSVIKVSVVLLPLMSTAPAPTQTDRDEGPMLRVLSFNILQGGGDASNVGFPNRDFGGSRYDELAAVVRLSQADVVGVQEDDGSDRLLTALGEGWKREGSFYSKCDLTLVRKEGWMTLCRLQLPTGNTIVVANCHYDAICRAAWPERLLVLDLLRHPPAGLGLCRDRDPVEVLARR